MLIYLDMQPENINQPESAVNQKSVLHQVTPLSKYLAMGLFILMPFIGGYIGYTLASGKVVEVVELRNSSDESNLILPKTESLLEKSAQVSITFQRVMGWIIYSYTDDEQVKGEGIYYDQSHGPIILDKRTVYTHEAGFDPTRVEVKKVDDTIANLVAELSENQMFSTTTSEIIQTKGHTRQHEVIKLSQSVTTNDCKHLTYLHEITESITGVVEISTCPSHGEGYDASKILVAESVEFLLKE